MLMRIFPEITTDYIREHYMSAFTATPLNISYAIQVLGITEAEIVDYCRRRKAERENPMNDETNNGENGDGVVELEPIITTPDNRHHHRHHRKAKDADADADSDGAGGIVDDEQDQDDIGAVAPIS
ncbi:hypothetical protein Pelo_19698 [Pelomyxa schiedti]|nr:hypothetical protein Pelo_19698 [Pelomyxa schiedti]